MPAPNPIYTIGHSTHPIKEFIGLLKAHNVVLLVDIRTLPRSRWNPQFNTQALEKSLKAEGIDYLHVKALGGMRKAREDSPNTAFRNGGFRGYADYMQTTEFEGALERLIGLASSPPPASAERSLPSPSRGRVREGAAGNIAIMCAEAVPWKCHRSLVADALVARGIPVINIMPDGKASPHELRDFAEIKNGRVTYPGVKDLFSTG